MTAAVPKVSTAINAGVMTVTMVDEDNRNTLGGQILSELIAAIDEAEADPTVRVVVVTNSGTVFCAGANLNEQTSGGSAGSFSMADLFERIRNSPLPFVGRINGHAVAGGLGLAAVMDISVAIDTAKHGFTEVRIGVAPAMISVVCLPKMTRADAAEAMLRGNRFLAPEAVRLGLINRAVPADEIDAEIASICADLIAGGPNAIAATKGLFDKVPDMAFPEAMAWTAELSSSLFKAEEGQAGMKAYLNKTNAPWIPEI